MVNYSEALRCIAFQKVSTLQSYCWPAVVSCVRDVNELVKRLLVQNILIYLFDIFNSYLFHNLSNFI